MDTCNSSESLLEKLGANLREANDASYQLTYTDIAAHRKALAATKGGLLAEIAQLKANMGVDAPDESDDEDDTSNNLTKLEWDAQMEKIRQDRLKMEEEHAPLTILGAQCAWQLQRTQGIKSHLILSRDLNIVSGDLPECWKWTSVPETIYAVAELVGVNLLDISCRINTSKLTPSVEYTAYLVFMFKREDEQLCPSLPYADAYLGVVGEEKSIRKVCLGSKPFTNGFRKEEDGDQTRLEEVDQCAEPFGYDGWWGVELGDYLVKEDEEVELEIGLKEISRSSLIKGLIIKGIEVKNRFM